MNSSSSSGSSSSSSNAASLPISISLGFAVLAAQKDGEEEDALTMEVKKGKLNELRENFTLAEEHYHAALRLNDEQRKQGIVDDMKALSHRAWILDAMANMAQAERKPYKAEKLFKEVIQILLQLGAPEHSPPILEISVKLANILATMEEEEKRKQAEVGFKFAIDSQKKTVEQLAQLLADGQEVPEMGMKEAQSLLGWAHQSYGFYLLEERRKSEALDQLQHSIAIAASVYGEDSEAYATMLNDSASAMADKNLFEEATKLLEQSLAIGKGKGWEAEAAFKINLGLISIHRRLFAEAEKYCKSGLELARKLKSSDGIEEAGRCLTELKMAMATAAAAASGEEAKCTAGESAAA